MNICAEAMVNDTQIKNPGFAHKFPKTFLSWWLPVMVWQCLNCNILTGFGIRILTLYSSDSHCAEVSCLQMDSSHAPLAVGC